MVAPGLLTLFGRKFSVSRSSVTVLGRQQALVGSHSAVLRRALAQLRGAGDEPDTGQRARGFVLGGGGVKLSHREVSCVGGLITCHRREISDLSDRVTLLSNPQALTRGLFTLPSGAPADVLAELMRFVINAGREIVIAGRLVMVGRDLVALRAGLIVLGGALIGVREGLVSFTDGLVGFGRRPVAFAEKRRPRG